MDSKPIPAFYCCYLLRSTVQRSFNYIGSTPHMVRRVKQHNGETKGGAKRTSRNTLKPWEVTCIVHGFPSKLAALQFEWAWQNTHMSRHAKDDGSNMLKDLDFRVSPKSGKVRKRKTAGKARSITDRITNLHILLRARSFDRLPLKLRFFATDVFRVFKTIDQKMQTSMRSTIDVMVDSNAIEHYEKNSKKDAPPVAEDLSTRLRLNGVENLDFGYTTLKPHLEQSERVLQARAISCSVCQKRAGKVEALLTCPHDGCNAVSHMSCLSKNFLRDVKDDTIMLPIEGKCPSCYKATTWEALVKELSLRSRGEKEMKITFKKARAKKSDKTAAADQLEADDSEEDELEETLAFEAFEADAVRQHESSSAPESLELPITVLGNAGVDDAHGQKSAKKKPDRTGWSDVDVLD